MALLIAGLFFAAAAKRVPPPGIESPALGRAIESNFYVLVMKSKGATMNEPRTSAEGSLVIPLMAKRQRCSALPT